MDWKALFDANADVKVLEARLAASVEPALPQTVLALVASSSSGEAHRVCGGLWLLDNIFTRDHLQVTDLRQPLLETVLMGGLPRSVEKPLIDAIGQIAFGSGRDGGQDVLQALVQLLSGSDEHKRAVGLRLAAGASSKTRFRSG